MRESEESESTWSFSSGAEARSAFCRLDQATRRLFPRSHPNGVRSVQVFVYWAGVRFTSASVVSCNSTSRQSGKGVVASRGPWSQKWWPDVRPRSYLGRFAPCLGNRAPRTKTRDGWPADRTHSGEPATVRAAPLRIREYYCTPPLWVGWERGCCAAERSG